MASPDPQVRYEISNNVGTILSDIALGLFILYFIFVVADILPIRLLDPLWIITLAGTLCNTATLPLAGLAFLHLAAALNSASRTIEERRILASRLAAWAALGFLLLLPLIGYANWKGIANVRLANQRNIAAVNRKAAELTNQIRQASTAKDLQERMAKSQGPAIPTEALFLPLENLKKQSLLSVQVASKALRNQSVGPFSEGYLPIYKQSLRAMALALGAAFSFAAGAWNPRTNTTLLASLSSPFKSFTFKPYSIFNILTKKLEDLKRSTSKDAVEAQRLSEWRRRKKESERAKALREREMKRNMAQQKKLTAQREKQRQNAEREARRHVNRNNRNP